jgi:hypothetical protein
MGNPAGAAPLRTAEGYTRRFNGRTPPGGIWFVRSANRNGSRSCTDGDEHRGEGCEESVKAQKRKHVLAERRRDRGAARKLARAWLGPPQVPIQHCLVTESLFEIGVGMMVLARGVTPHYVAFGSFLIDVFCLGVKDAMLNRLQAKFFRDADGCRGCAIDVWRSRATPASCCATLPRGRNRPASSCIATLRRSRGFFGHVSADASDEGSLRPRRRAGFVFQTRATHHLSLSAGPAPAQARLRGSDRRAYGH